MTLVPTRSICARMNAGRMLSWIVERRRRDREMFFTSGCSCQDLISSASGTKANSHVFSQVSLLCSSSMCFTRSNCIQLYRHLSVYILWTVLSALFYPHQPKLFSEIATMNRPKGGLASSNHDWQNPRDIIIFQECPSFSSSALTDTLYSIFCTVLLLGLNCLYSVFVD